MRDHISLHLLIQLQLPPMFSSPYIKTFSAGVTNLTWREPPYFGRLYHGKTLHEWLQTPIRSLKKNLMKSHRKRNPIPVPWRWDPSETPLRPLWDSLMTTDDQLMTTWWAPDEHLMSTDEQWWPPDEHLMSTDDTVMTLWWHCDVHWFVYLIYLFYLLILFIY